MGHSEFGYIVLGVVIFCLRFLPHSVTNKIQILQTANNRLFVLVMLNLVVLAGTLGLTLYGIHITAKVNTMTPAELSHLGAQLTTWINGFFHLLFVFAGIAGAAVIWSIWEGIRKPKDKKEIMPKDTRLDTIINRLDNLTDAVNNLAKPVRTPRKKTKQNKVKDKEGK